MTRRTKGSEAGLYLILLRIGRSTLMANGSSQYCRLFGFLVAGTWALYGCGGGGGSFSPTPSQ